MLAVETSRPATLAVDDCVRVHVRADSGVDASVDLAWSIDKSLADFLHVYGTEGEARVGWRESALRRYGGDWENIGPGYGKHPAMGSALCPVLPGGAGRGVARGHASEGVIAAQTIEAAYESIAARRLGQAGRARLTIRWPTRIHPTALVEAGVEIGDGTSVWDNVHIRGPETSIGTDCIVGEKTYIAYGVHIGDRVKINAFVYVCNAVDIEDGVHDLGRHDVHQRPLPACDARTT